MSFVKCLLIILISLNRVNDFCYNYIFLVEKKMYGRCLSLFYSKLVVINVINVYILLILFHVLKQLSIISSRIIIYLYGTSTYRVDLNTHEHTWIHTETIELHD